MLCMPLLFDCRIDRHTVASLETHLSPHWLEHKRTFIPRCAFSCRCPLRHCADGPIDLASFELAGHLLEEVRRL